MAKEELYLLFRRYLEPRLLYYLEYLLYFLNKLNIKVKPPIKSLLFRGKLIPLVVGFSPKLNKYLAFQNRMIFLSEENWKEELDNLDKSKDYLLIGNEEYLEYLKEQKLKIRCDG